MSYADVSVKNGIQMKDFFNQSVLKTTCKQIVSENAGDFFHNLQTDE